MIPTAEQLVINGETVTPLLNESPFIRGINNPTEIAARVNRAKQIGIPPKLVFFWGPHPTKQDIGKADTRTVSAIQQTLAKVGIPTSNILPILADSHGSFNSVIDNGVGNLKQIQEMFKDQFGVDALWLSNLYEENELTLNKGELTAIATARGVQNNQALTTHLNRGAETRGQNDGGLAYAGMRIQEAQMIRDLVGDDGIFVVIGDPEYQPIFPAEIPIIYTNAKPAGKRGGNPETAPWLQNIGHREP